MSHNGNSERTSVLPTCTLALCVLWVLSGSTSAIAQDAGVTFFEKQVRPLLRRECLNCHNTNKASGSLALDSRQGWQTGGDSGPALVPGEPDKSLLLRAVRHAPNVVAMPAKAPKLPDESIAILEKWIRLGAPDPRDKPEALDAAEAGSWDAVARERAQWWCWQPLRPKSSDSPAPHTIDDWIDRGLAEGKILPAPMADRRTLIRRLSFQLSGLPPTPAEVEAFAHDASADAWAHCVDRFLAKPEFGIHWARHWLDVVRYGETHGSEDDALLPFAYRYRDYLIRAFQEDVSYQQLIREHLAGDLIPPRWNTSLGVNEALIGTAFLRFVEFNQTPVDVKREEIVVIDNQIDALGKAFQGLTISCARCHDHKFDPISDEDYYALYGIFRSTRTAMRVIDDPQVFTRETAALQTLQDPIRHATATLWIQQIANWPRELEQARVWCQQHVKPETNWKDLQPQVPAAPWTKALAYALCKPDGKAPERHSRPALNWVAQVLVADTASYPAIAEQKHRDLADQFQRSQSLPTGCSVLFDLTNGNLTGWQIVGVGLPPKTVNQAGAWSATGGRESPFSALLERGYHSNTVSDRYGGSLRSPDFVLDMDEISLLVRGTGQARARLVIENFQGDSLLFDAVNPTLDSPSLRWVTLPIRPQWRNLRAHLELLTRDDKPYIGVTKDPKILEQSDGRSSFGIAQVVKHPRGGRPVDPPTLPAEFTHIGPTAESRRTHGEWLTAFCDESRHVIERFERGTSTDLDARWISTLLQAGVLSCQAPESQSLKTLTDNYQRLESTIPVARRTPGVHEDHCAVDQPWLPRGDHRQPGDPVPRRYLAVLGSVASSYAGTESGRRQLAEEIASPQNPLTARVYVNRVWHWLYGRGLVATVDNFGRMGEPPTHPELLDQLAIEFMDEEWSTKRLIKKLLLTQAWQRSSTPTATASEIDPGNRFWSHASVRRLDAEAIRDTLLLLTGTMRSSDSGLGTLGYYRVMQDPNKQSPQGPLDGDSRRSIFLEVRRNFPNEFLLAFDFPRPTAPAGRRPLAIVPAQSLTLMNDPFVIHASRLWAERVCRTESDDHRRIALLYRELLNREPTPDELRQSAELVAQITTRKSAAKAWHVLAHALFNLKEAIYLP
ncbi:MAG: PSD1 domain-containing protein [Planctomycetes bacterium]|nr:PSD1 domain-containing protein [Planctomycetota bacterium]